MVTSGTLSGGLAVSFLLLSNPSRFFDLARSRLLLIVWIGYPLCKKKPPSVSACLSNSFQMSSAFQSRPVEMADL